ncbi:PrsW family intramembrane metalloprotease [Candidatus Nomurabacteria bacterium]|nr:PrsW family intramembrane metalloprotease [Candidatus Nomurabacteria bacterium]
MITTDPKILVLAFLGGFIPSFLWLWFWLKEEEHPEPKGLLTVVFIMGMVSVFIALPIEKFIQANVGSQTGQIILWASAEEILKYLAVLVVLYKSDYINEPIDWPIYIITTALGFAALENAFFLIRPFSVNQATVALLTGQLRFLGSTLLHTVTSGTIGIAVGLSFFMSRFGKKWFLFMGFIVAIALHSAFNFFIMRNSGNDFLKVSAFLWVVTIIIMLLFEKVRRMSEDYQPN